MRRSLLLCADTHKSADQLYFGGFSVPDAFISFKKGRKSYAVLSQLEYARASKESRFDVLLPLEECMGEADAKFGGSKVGYAEIIATLAEEFEIPGFRIPSDFSAGLAFKLQEYGVDLEVAEGSLFPQRETKTEEELKFIKEGNKCSVAGIRAAEDCLKKAVIKKGQLILDGKPLTSERLREAIEIACLQVGSISMDTIAAGGDQACDPHCAGSGPLKANELIIVDVFPRVSKTGYHGDMTRTFLKGTPSEAQKALVAAVRYAQKEALKEVKTGVDGKKVHGRVCEVFDQAGYETKRDENGAVGFFHGTGHGLGLEVHEMPRVSTVSNKLKENAVVTIEPGLYYPGTGGCRIEDVVAVKKEGYQKLSSYHYRWVIK
ncbi:MAG: aminopeptidase P family protein [Symploca sp. SIO2D2]|nr:aminopeptidase P family protein [Symploca sp. SIO2D2]